MRGADITQEALFCTVHLDTFVPAAHPLRAIRELLNEALGRLEQRFNAAYAPYGKASIAPERLIRALALQVFYSIRSERALMEQIQYNLLFRWFIGLSIEDAVWSHSTFSKNRDRLLQHEVIGALFDEVVEIARKRNLLSAEHFSVDGTLIQAWASQKSFRPKDGGGNDAKDGAPHNAGGGPGSGRNAERDFHGEKRSNVTHASTTDPDARNYRKSAGVAAKLAYLGHTLMENRSGLMVDARVSLADGYGERETALAMLRDLPGGRRKSVGADKNYDTRGFVAACRQMNVTPHVAQNTRRAGGSAIDGRTTRHAGYAISRTVRKRIEEGFGWGKTVGPIRQVKHRGRQLVEDVFKLSFACFNLLRISNLQQRCVQ